MWRSADPGPAGRDCPFAPIPRPHFLHAPGASGGGGGSQGGQKRDGKGGPVAGTAASPVVIEGADPVAHFLQAFRELAAMQVLE